VGQFLETSQIRAGTKRLFARTVQDGDRQRIVVAKLSPRAQQQAGSLAVDGVMHLGSIDRNLKDISAVNCVRRDEDRCGIFV
jgi:hypothetical protein